MPYACGALALLTEYTLIYEQSKKYINLLIPAVTKRCVPFQREMMSWSKLVHQRHLRRPLIPTCRASMSMFRSDETRKRKLKYEKKSRNRLSVLDPEEERKLPSKSGCPVFNLAKATLLLVGSTNLLIVIDSFLLPSLPIRLRESLDSSVHLGHGVLRRARCPRAPPAEAEEEGAAAGDASTGKMRVRRDGAREGRGLRLRLHGVRVGRQGEPHHGHGNKQGRTNRYFGLASHKVYFVAVVD